MFLVYALLNEKGQIYVGQTDNLEKRLERHNAVSKNRSLTFTYQKGPWRILYQELHPTRKEALIREKELKSHRGRTFLRSLVQ